MATKMSGHISEYQTEDKSTKRSSHSFQAVAFLQTIDAQSIRDVDTQ
jgi:hypothetical protein